MTKRQRIDASREARLWIRDIIIPTATVVVTAMAIPEVRETASAKFNEVKTKLSNKFKK